MIKKLLISLTAVVILYAAAVVPFQQVYANPIVKIVAGSTTAKVLKGVAEKAGMKFANKSQYDNFLGNLNSKSSSNSAVNQFLTDFDNAVKAYKPSSESGWKKYVIDPFLWATGADILFDIYDGFMAGMNGGTEVEIEKSSSASSVFKCYVTPPNKYGQLTFYPDVPGYNFNYTGDIGTTREETFQSCTVVGSDYQGIGINAEWHVFHVDYLVNTDDGPIPADDIIVSVNLPISNNTTYNGTTNTFDTNLTMIPISTDLPDITAKIDIPDDITIIPEVEIKIPDEDNTDITDDDTWNDPIVIVLPPTDPDAGNGEGGVGDLTPIDDPIDTPKNFFTVMQEMGKKVTDMYNGLVSFMENSVASMTALTAGTAGLVSYLGTFFSWLPPDYVTLLSVALMLGVVGFFLRR